MRQITFASGMYVRKPSPAQWFIVANIGIDVEQFVGWLRQQEQVKGFVNLQICHSQAGNFYCQLVPPWKPEPAPEPVRSSPPLTERLPPAAPKGRKGKKKKPVVEYHEDFNDDLPF